MRTRLQLVGVVILALALGAGSVIYATAPDDEDNLAIQEMLLSKRYNREVERFGGKAAVLFNELGDWFAARWRGKSLGITVIFLGALASGCVFLAARRYRD